MVVDLLTGAMKLRDAWPKINGNLNGLNNELSSLGSGAPAGVYATAAALSAAIPAGNANVYVVTADGNWYYWSGAAWTAGGVYAAMEAGKYGLFYNSVLGGCVKFNSVAKTMVIGAYTKIITETHNYTLVGDGGTSGSNKTVDLSSKQNGVVVFFPATLAFGIYAHDAASYPTNGIIMATYGNYGAYVNMAGVYTVDGAAPLADASISTAKLADLSVTTAKIANAATTLAKRTSAGLFGVLFSALVYPAFNSVAKTLTIAAYSRMMCGATYYPLLGNDGTTNTVKTIDLSGSPTGYITLNLVTKAWAAYAHTAAIGNENEVIVATYGGYGAVANIVGGHTIDGNLYGIDLTNMLSPDYEYIALPEGIEWWSDFIVVGANMWFFVASSGEEHTTTAKIHVVALADWSYVGYILHDFGHCNTVHYDAENDFLVIGNLPGSIAYPAALYIFYDVSTWALGSTVNYATADKTIVDLSGAGIYTTQIACALGEHNLTARNIAYVSSGYNVVWFKILMGMGTNGLEHGTYSAADADKFNGTWQLIKQDAFAMVYESGKEVIQGADFYNGQVLTANGHDGIFGFQWYFTESGNIRRRIIQCPAYNADGTEYECTSEGITVYDGYVYQGCLKDVGGVYGLVKYSL